MTRDTWCGVNNLSKFQLPSSNGLGGMMFCRFGGKGSLTQSMNDLITEVFVEQPWLHRICYQHPKYSATPYFHFNQCNGLTWGDLEFGYYCHSMTVKDVIFAKASPFPYSQLHKSGLDAYIGPPPPPYHPSSCIFLRYGHKL